LYIVIKAETHLPCLLSLTLDKSGGRRGGSALPLTTGTLSSLQVAVKNSWRPLLYTFSPFQRQQHQRHQHPETSRCFCKTPTPSGSGTPRTHRHQSGHRGEQRFCYCCSSNERISSPSPSGSIHSSNSAIIDNASSLSVIPYFTLLILHSLM